MDASLAALAAGLVNDAYITQGLQSLQARTNLLKNLLAQRRVPEDGWDDASIEYVVQQLALMDSNNFGKSVGLGEREARVICPLVQRRNYYLGHGIGRSGDIAAIQPKAAGSSLLYQITNALALDIIKMCGVTRAQSCLLLPMATGMSLMLTLVALRRQRPSSAKYVVWSRIDQRSCLKSIFTAGLEPVVVELKVEGDELITDLEAIEETITRLGPENVVCVMSTTSCFAPRGADKVADIAQICRRLDVGHVINNAYGLQASKLTHQINEACRVGRVDAFVQSTDKNLLVPVGGSMVASADPAFVSAISQQYAGRASMAPILDVFMTLLHLGRSGYKALLDQRKDVAEYLRTKLDGLAAAIGERVMRCPHNPISYAMSIGHVTASGTPTYFGSLLFSRGVSGTRVVPVDEVKSVDSLKFRGYGSHTNAYPVPYVTIAAAIGLTREDVDLFLARFLKTVHEYHKQMSRKSISTPSASVISAVTPAAGSDVSAGPELSSTTALVALSDDAADSGSDSKQE